jgi:hypothetical protein
MTQTALLAARKPAQTAALKKDGLSARPATARGGHLAQLAQAINTGPRVQNLVQLKAVLQKRDAAPSANRTGLPDRLKAGVEHLSGLSMDRVRVHYNSSRPAQLSALAYAQGTDIHVAPGQERHLPHEAWHVVQQAQGRVRATEQMANGTAVNSDRSLEAEADRMGHAAAGFGGSAPVSQAMAKADVSPGQAAAQRKTEIHYQTQQVAYTDALNQSHSETVGKVADAFIDVTDHVVGSAPEGQQKQMYDRLKAVYGQTFIRGHLLNDHVGGVGEIYNLFPITSHANSEHKITAEGHLKQHIRTELEAHDAAPAEPAFVHYRVQAVANNPADLAADARAVFLCDMVSAHNHLPGGQNESWKIISVPGAKETAEGDRSSKDEYSNSGLGSFGASGTGESAATLASRLRSTVNGWKGDQNSKFVTGGGKIDAFLSLSAAKDKALEEIDHYISDKAEFEGHVDDILEKSKNAFMNTPDAASFQQAFEEIKKEILKLELQKRKEQLLNTLGSFLAPLSIPDANKHNVYNTVAQTLTTIGDLATLEQAALHFQTEVPKHIQELQQQQPQLPGPF